MTKYVKKPIEVEAVQWFKMGDHPEVFETWRCQINTLEGTIAVLRGDWIVTYHNGVHYPVKDDIFRAIYDEVKNEN